MSFDNDYPNRKDHRKPYYRKAYRVDASCRPGGSDEWCQWNRLYSRIKADIATREELRAYYNGELTLDD